VDYFPICVGVSSVVNDNEYLSEFRSESRLDVIRIVAFNFFGILTPNLGTAHEAVYFTMHSCSHRLLLYYIDTLHKQSSDIQS